MKLEREFDLLFCDLCEVMLSTIMGVTTREFPPTSKSSFLLPTSSPFVALVAEGSRKVVVVGVVVIAHVVPVGQWSLLIRYGRTTR